MRDILEEIIASKRLEIAERSVQAPLMSLESKAYYLSTTHPHRSMRHALTESPIGIIAEFKRKSPSKGWLHPDADVKSILPDYEQGGASACSILTDAPFFGGTPHDLIEGRSRIKLPILRKDFIIDEYQIYESAYFEADAILLIASVLTAAEIAHFTDLAHELKLEVLLEIHDTSELTKISPSVDMLGINNRHLGTFHTEVDHSFRLVETIRSQLRDNPNAPLLISESGISDISTIARLRSVGFRGFLIGERFMRESDPGLALADFVSEFQSSQNNTV
jgi:indole-3-glycerol phosphate synthase